MLRADPEILRETGSWLTEIIGDLDTSGFENICGDPGEYGNDELFGSVEEFCSALRLGVDVLKRTIESTGVALNETAQNYEQSDEAAAGELTGIVNDLQARMEVSG